MLSGVLRSDRAIAVNIEIMRTFVELRRVASSYAALQERLEDVERGDGGRGVGGPRGIAVRGRRLQPQSLAASMSSRSARSRVRPAARFIAFRSSIEQTATATPRLPSRASPCCTCPPAATATSAMRSRFSTARRKLVRSTPARSSREPHQLVAQSDRLGQVDAHGSLRVFAQPLHPHGLRLRGGR